MFSYCRGKFQPAWSLRAAPEPVARVCSRGSVHPAQAATGGSCSGVMIVRVWFHSACPALAVEVTVVDGFGEVVRSYCVRVIEVGYGAGHLKDPVIGPG